MGAFGFDVDACAGEEEEVEAEAEVDADDRALEVFGSKDDFGSVFLTGRNACGWELLGTLLALALLSPTLMPLCELLLFIASRSSLMSLD